MVEGTAEKIGQGGVNVSSKNRVLSQAENEGPSNPSRRSFLKRFGIIAAGLASVVLLGKGAEKIHNETTSDLMGKPREEGVFRAEIVSITDPNPDSSTGLIAPKVRENPSEGAKEIAPDEYKKYGIQLQGEVRGKPVWGGSYIGIAGGTEPVKKDIVYDRRGLPMGKWFKVDFRGEDGEARSFYIADSFVRYGEKIPGTDQQAQKP